MPPLVVKCVRDLVFWQYTKIISESAGAGKRQYGFVCGQAQQACVWRNLIVNIRLRARDSIVLL